MVPRCICGFVAPIKVLKSSTAVVFSSRITAIDWSRRHISGKASFKGLSCVPRKIYQLVQESNWSSFHGPRFLKPAAFDHFQKYARVAS